MIKKPGKNVARLRKHTRVRKNKRNIRKTTLKRIQKPFKFYAQL